MPEGVERHRFRRARKASMLDGVAARRAPRGNGVGFEDGSGPEGMGSPEGRSAIAPVDGRGAVDIVSVLWCWVRLDV